MIVCIGDSHTNKPNIRTITYQYDVNEDKNLLKEIDQLILVKQRHCSTCRHFYKEGFLGGYSASCCEIHGILDHPGNQHYDFDGRKCDDYIKERWYK